MMTSRLLLMAFLINEIQARKHRWKKYVDGKEEYVEIQTSFGDIAWKYLGWPMNFSASLHWVNIYSWINNLGTIYDQT